MVDGAETGAENKKHDPNQDSTTKKEIDHAQESHRTHSAPAHRPATGPGAGSHSSEFVGAVEERLGELEEDGDEKDEEDDEEEDHLLRFLRPALAKMMAEVAAGTLSDEKRAAIFTIFGELGGPLVGVVDPIGVSGRDALRNKVENLRFEFHLA